MDTQDSYKDPLHRAISFAHLAHGSTQRKVLSHPYIMHPFEVWIIVAREGGDVETQIAALLHDTVEDTFVTFQLIREQFGEKVEGYVRELTEEKKEGQSIDQKKATWRERKLANLTRATSRQAKLIKLADRLSNSRDMRMEYVMFGDEIWKKFNMSKSGQEWYYLSTLEHLKEFEHLDSYKELQENYSILFDK